MHPITYLVTELFETHDRERFTVYGYCSTKDDGSKERARVIAAFDRFTSIAALSDEAAARAIRADEIDILVDLNGLTLGNRLHILRWRPAPVQITYLGYNGPMPMDELDHILADPFVIPPDVAARYSPRSLMLPRCFQANDTKLAVAPAGTRAEAGLPEDMFVFCCFSNNYKITEAMFEAWMQILDRAEGSVLWLYADNAMARANLEARAAARGIGRDRLIFAPRAEPATYRGRLALADLFLDTYPYNAGTTASDALRVGLPIVTLCGESFIARMAGSLLNAIGLEEGIVATLDAYVERAVTLATDAALYGVVRRKASPEAWARTLGNTPAFTRDIEALYQSIARRSDAPAGSV
jgi:predicted O-linked N-acetylglucosamine transferase (SPINDLY family)